MSYTRKYPMFINFTLLSDFIKFKDYLERTPALSKYVIHAAYRTVVYEFDSEEEKETFKKELLLDRNIQLAINKNKITID